MPLPYKNLIQKYAEALLSSSDEQRSAADVSVHLELIARGKNAEQEFAAILAWLGRVKLIHPLDQQFSPPRAKARYAVPDLLAVFEVKGQLKPFLIEVKTTKSKVRTLTQHEPKLRLSNRYYKNLDEYSKVTGIPLLIAWKNSAFTPWTLFELRHLKKVNKNYSIGLLDAMRQSLMSELAGDYSFVFRENVGLTIETDIHQETSTYEDGRRTGFTGTVKEAYITDGHGNKVKSMGAVWPLFMTADVPFDQRFVDDKFITTAIIPAGEQLAEFLHRALIASANLMAKPGEAVNWNELRLSNRFPFSAQEIDKAIRNDDATPLISSIIHTRPADAVEY